MSRSIYMMMAYRPWLAVFVVFAIASAGGPARAQVNNAYLWAGSKAISSQLQPLIDDGTARPIAGAEIVLRGGALGGMTTMTDVQGLAELEGEVGVYDIHISGGMISGGNRLIRIETGDPVKKGFYLHDAPPDLYRRMGFGATIRLFHRRMEIRIVDPHRIQGKI